jgi:hypothetical protein
MVTTGVLFISNSGRPENYRTLCYEFSHTCTSVIPSMMQAKTKNHMKESRDKNMQVAW